MTSITAKGFCAVAAESRYTSGLPWMVCLRTGKSSRSFSTSNAAVTSLLSVLMKFLEEYLFQQIAQALHFNPIHNILRKRVGQQTARFPLANAARLQVEQRFAIQLADSGAMRAAHVIGIDLQLRLGIHHRIVGEHQILIGLLGIGLLRVFADDDFAIEDGVRLARQNSFIHFVAPAVRAWVLGSPMFYP